MNTLRLILGDQLSETLSSLEGCHTQRDVILIAKVWEEATYVKHHKKKIAFIFSAMRHFADYLSKRNHRVCYTKLNDSKNTGSLRGEVKRTLQTLSIGKIIVTHPREYRLLQDLRQWEEKFKVPVEIREDKRFFCKLDEFQTWSKQYKSLRMEYFYQDMRKKHHILMDGDKPISDRWNYDTENQRLRI